MSCSKNFDSCCQNFKTICGPLYGGSDKGHPLGYISLMDAKASDYITPKIFYMLTMDLYEKQDMATVKLKVSEPGNFYNRTEYTKFIPRDTFIAIMNRISRVFGCPQDKGYNSYKGKELMVEYRGFIWRNVGPEACNYMCAPISPSPQYQAVYTDATQFLEKIGQLIFMKPPYDKKIRISADPNKERECHSINGDMGIKQLNIFPEQLKSL